MKQPKDHWVRAASLGELPEAGCKVVHVERHTLVIVREKDRLYAIDNRCPHMGFPLDRGSVHDGILTCHWHHARFDLCTGGTFDQFADDVPAFPVEVRDGGVWIDVAPRRGMREHYLQRLEVGLERDIPLVIGKAVLPLLEKDSTDIEPFRIGLQFGTRYRRAGWGPGLTIHTCMRNLLPWLDADDRPRAFFHGLSAVAADCDGQPPRFPIKPLPAASASLDTLKSWFRKFIEVRDAEGAERCVASAVRSGADSRQMADMLFAAATDHRYIDIGHPLDFTNKALEALDVAGWQHAEETLTSLVSGYASAVRMEESNAWRHPIDLVVLLESAFEELHGALKAGEGLHKSWQTPETLVPCLLADDPQAIVAALLDAMRHGCPPVDLAGLTAYAAALRIARFPVTNEFPDWDTSLHTFTFANAVHQGLRRCDSPEVLRGVFDAAMSVYLDRFLNVPAVPLPERVRSQESGIRSQESASALAAELEERLGELTGMLDRRHEVDAAAGLVAEYLAGGGEPDRLLALMAKLLLREDRNFHTIQTVEAAFRQHELLPASSPARGHVLIAAVRYLAAHAPTMRSQGQTWRIAWRLHRGESLFEESESR